MPLWSNTNANTSAPKYTVDVTNGLTGVQAYNATPVGTYAYTRANTVNGINSGWNLKTVGTGNRSDRTFHETLISMNSMDYIPSSNNPSLTISTQPSNTTVAVGANATFAVNTTITGDTVLTYQWYTASPTQNTVFFAIANAKSNTYIKSNVSLSDANTLYRVVISGTNGVSSVTSNTAKLIVS